MARAKIIYNERSYIIDEHTGKGGYKILILEIHNAGINNTSYFIKWTKPYEAGASGTTVRTINGTSKIMLK